MPSSDTQPAAASEPAGPQSFTDLPPAERLSDEFLLGLLSGLLSQDPDRIRRTIHRHFAPDALLVHTLARAEGAADLYRMFRAYTAAFIVHPIVREIVIDLRPRTTRSEPRGDVAAGAPPPSGAGCAVLWTDQHVWLRALPFLSGGVYPTVTFLKFKPCPKTGQPLVYELYDHVSRDAYVMSLGGIASWMHQHLLQPMGRFTAVLLADAFDWLDAAWARLSGGTGPAVTPTTRGTPGPLSGTAATAAAAMKSSFLGSAAVHGGPNGSEGGRGGVVADWGTETWGRPASGDGGGSGGNDISRSALAGTRGRHGGEGTSPYGSDYTPSTGTTTARSSSTGGGATGAGHSAAPRSP